MRSRIGQPIVALGVVVSLAGALGAVPAAAADDDEGGRGVIALAQSLSGGDTEAFGGGGSNALQLFLELTGD